jgi:hypothetical protein
MTFVSWAWSSHVCARLETCWARAIWIQELQELQEFRSQESEAQAAMDSGKCLASFPILCVSVNSVNSVRAFLPPDSCAPTFEGRFRCFPGRRKTRTEVTGFTEGLTDIELARPSIRIHGAKHIPLWKAAAQP